MAASETAILDGWIRRLQAGDAKARDHLLAAADGRLRRLARKMLKGFPVVHRWEQTGDVWQNAALKLHNALADIVPESVRHFLNLAALQIRRVLIDLSRHYGGPQGLGANHASNPRSDGDDGSNDCQVLDPAERSTCNPERLERWAEFHRQVELLPDEEREVFNLLWYQGLSQMEAARMLEIDMETLRQRWKSARLKLFDALHCELPE